MNMTILLCVCEERRGDEMIGHVPRELSSKVCYFLRHGG